ncbi:MAG TPA: HupE/UreJ family protein [Casimicrobiaceae bacterium]|nr:HupE/UreJ family protein [Casimicrobiaceae bacterium]
MIARRALAQCVCIVALAFATAVFAHKSSDAYLTILRTDRDLVVRFDAALRDLELAIGLDANGDGDITWGEVRGRHAAIAALALERLKLTVDGRRCPLSLRGHRVDTHTDGAYAVIDLAGRCETSGPLAIDYRLLFDVDPQHRGLISITDGATTQSLVLSADRPTANVGDGGLVAQFVSYLREGSLHIFNGLDHLLFIVALLLPAVLVRRQGTWLAADRFRNVAWGVLGVITAFTLAHALTLTLAALGVLRVPSRVAESLVALSIVVTALNNLRPTVERARWGIAFAFGLVHGLGFANVLAGLNLPGNVLLVALVAFNLGVELGQIVVAAVLLPIAFMLRDTVVYRRVVLVGGSILVALLGLAWFVERAFGVPVFTR